ncbi:MAG: PE-PPE domain-containing protein, partial [Chloroflexi bacterium]
TQYPAAMIPGIDSTTWNNSADIASDSIYNATKANGNGYDHLFGYSQGSGGTLMAAQRIAGENGGVLPDNIDVTMLGAPSTPGTGFFKDTKVQMAKPLFDMMGIDVDPGDAPAGTTYYGKPGDIWANGGSRNIITQTGQALGTAFGGTHGYSPAELQNPANIITDVNGVKVVHVADDLSGYGHAARANGLEWSDSAEQLVDAVAPEGIVGRPAPAPDMQAAFTAGSKVIEETAAFHGMPIDIPDAQLPAMPNPMDIAPAAPAGGTPPVLEQVQQVVEQFTQPAPAYDAYVPPVMEQVQQVVEQFTQQAPAPVAAPAAMPQMEQINTAINDAVQNSPFAQFLPR